MATTRGDFNSISSMDSMSREMLSSALKAIDSVEGAWDFLASYSPPENQGFMFVNPSPPMLTKIQDAILAADGGHSGSSYGWTLRQIEYIAKNGWDAFVDLNNDDDETKKLKKKVAKLEDENTRLRAQLAALSLPKKEMTHDEKVRSALAKGCTGGYPCAGCLARKNMLVEDWEREQKVKETAPLTNALQNLATLGENLTKAGVTNPTPLNIAEASRGVPGFEGQADAMTRFAEGKMSYAEMRSLCG